MEWVLRVELTLMPRARVRRASGRGITTHRCPIVSEADERSLAGLERTVAGREPSKRITPHIRANQPPGFTPKRDQFSTGGGTFARSIFNRTWTSAAFEEVAPMLANVPTS